MKWDGKQCAGSWNNCCANPDTPWFFRQLARSVIEENLEIRNCQSADFENEGVLVKNLELYIQ